MPASSLAPGDRGDAVHLEWLVDGPPLPVLSITHSWSLFSVSAEGADLGGQVSHSVSSLLGLEGILNYF